MTHLETLTPLLGIVAAERTASRPDLYDDVRQEAMIRAWEVETARPDAPREYVLAAAKRGAGDVLRGRPGFGAPSRRGWQDAHDDAGPLTPSDDVEVDTVAPLVDLASLAAFEAADLVDVRELVREAVLALPEADRELVVWRFWEGRAWTEIGPLVGRSPNAVRVRFEKHIAPALRSALYPMEPAA